MGVEPRLQRFKFLLIDFDRAVLANPYDDRGMDVAAAEPKEIASLYHRFDNWLLAFDRPRMDRTFGALGKG